MILSKLVYGLNETKMAKFILISSDHEVNKKILAMSGMGRRVKFVDFKSVPKD